MARHRATEILSHLDSLGNGLDPRADKAASRLRDCGEYLLFRHYHQVDEVRLHAAQFCRQHLVCPLCAVRRSAKQVGAYLERFELLTADAPELRPVFITYTVKNGPDLSERMAHLRRGLSVLTERRKNARKRAKGGASTWRHIAGAVGAIEATYSPQKGWHPHMHMVALCDGYMKQEDMVREWREITGDSFIVGISALDPGQPPADAFLECFKYALKFADMEPGTIWEAAQTLAGQRLMFSLGNFRGVQVPEGLTDEPLADQPFVEWMFRYLGQGQYSRTHRGEMRPRPPRSVRSQP